MASKTGGGRRGEYRELDRETAKWLEARQNKAIYPEAFVKFSPDGTFLPKMFAESSSLIENLTIRDDDLWICSFIKAGTTWTKEMAWLLQHDLDFEGAKVQGYQRITYLEFDATWPLRKVASKIQENETESKHQTTMDIAASSPSPRAIQSHLPWSLLPKELREGTKQPKIIYVARNPKDLCVSFYHHRVLIEGYLGSIDDYVDEFIKDLTFYGPFWTHVREFWERRHEPNVLFLTYEGLKADLSSVVDKTAKFLGKKLTAQEKALLMDHLSFEKMKANPYINLDDITQMITEVHGISRKTNFFRKGKVGSWKEELSPESIAKLDAWIKLNKIEELWDDLK